MLNVGICIPSNVPDAQPDTALEFARRAEAAGVHSVWTLDRVVFDSQDPLIMMAAVAGATTRVQIGASVLLGALRPPVLLARMAATIDQISGGRLLLGLGAGSKKDDFEATEIPFEHRGSRLEEVMSIMKLVWSGQPVSYHGRFYDIDVGPVGPEPVQQPHPPLWMGGFAESVLKRAGKAADGYIGHGGPTDFRECFDKVQAYAAEFGRDPSAIVPAAVVHVCVDDDPSQAEALTMKHFSRYWGPARAHVPDGSMMGPPEACLEAAHQFIEQGANTLILTSVTADLDHLDRLLEDVVPGLLKM